MQIGNLLNKLQKAKSIGNGEFEAICPAHKDDEPSLHIKQSEDRLLLNCKAGCTTENIVAKLGLTMADLFIPTDIKIKPKIVTEYNYKDEQGNVLYQVVRFDPKDFRQRHKNGGGEWKWNMDGVKRVLYHLDGLKEVTTQTVYLVEGEKDADNLWDKGLIATTSPGGAGNWKPEYAAHLKGKKVVIIPDKDAAGYGYAQKASLSIQGIASSVATIILPGDKVKDVTDWIEQGGDVKLLPSMEQSIECLTKLTNEQKSDKTDTSDKCDLSDISDETNNSDKTYIERQGRVIWKLVDEWLPLHQGEKFDLDTICRQLDVKTRDDRHRVVQKLSYEVDRENLEKSDRLYIYINKTFKLIDWVNASPLTNVNIKWPYGIRDKTIFGFDGYVNISPGDIIVIAGVSNMGKSLFVQNLLWENMDNYPCTLMGNEYTPGKFKRRVSRMTWRNPLKDDGTPKFELMERREGWKDVIRPNNINIIDWINLDDNFYKMGSIIDGIQSKLKDGIAIICIQKSEGKGLGLGGGFSEHLASLYLTIDFEHITVRKLKEWSGHNANGEIYRFKIENGGTMFEDIHTVKKCSRCGGTGKTKMGDCDSCFGKGDIDIMDSYRYRPEDVQQPELVEASNDNELPF